MPSARGLIVGASALLAACGSSFAEHPDKAPVVAGKNGPTDPANAVSTDGGEGTGPVPPESTSGPSKTADAGAMCRASSAAFNLAVGGTATASHAAGSAVEAFDDNTGTKWVADGSPPFWIGYEFARTGTEAVQTYTLTSPSDGAPEMDPASWDFQGSNDRSGSQPITWTTLDTRSNQVSIGRQVTRTFSIEHKTAYRQYRLVVKANGGGPHTELAELQLFGPGTPVFSIDDAVTGAGMHHFKYSGRWEGHIRGDTKTVPAKYGLSSSWSRVPGEFVTFAFTGSQIKLYGVVHSQHGIAGISLDDGSETEVDTYGPLKPNVLVYTSPVVCVGLHQLKVRVTGKKNAASTDAFISIDRAQVVP